jgi:chromosome partitioning protein
LKSLVLFNNKGGVGKTTLGYHIAHMMARRGLRVVVLDYDPQCNISAAFVPPEELEELWDDDAPREPGRTVSGCIENVRRGKGELLPPALYQADDNLWLLPGHLRLSRFEQPLAEEWGRVSSANNERALDITLALTRLAHSAGDRVGADVVLVDVGPSLGALNRAALLACDVVVVPVAPDLFSLQGLRNVGPTLREWREDWHAMLAGIERRGEGAPEATHDFTPAGYIVQQHLVRADRPIKAYEKWALRIPNEYHRHVLGEPHGFSEGYELDPARIFFFRHYASLVPLALDARKPMFDLKPADGINGSLYKAVASCRRDVNALVTELARRLGVPVGEEP